MCILRILCINETSHYLITLREIKNKTMKYQVKESVTATVLARNIAQTIDHVRYSKNSINIIKGNKVIARLSPPPKSGLAMDDLIELINLSPKLGEAESLLMAKDVERIRDNAKLPENPWD